MWWPFKGRKSEYNGVEAIKFAKRHLRKIEVRERGWEVEYEDPRTGEGWIMDWPHSEAQGGGPPRLRKTDS